MAYAFRQYIILDCTMRLWSGSNANLGPDRIARSKVHFSVTAGILTTPYLRLLDLGNYKYSYTKKSTNYTNHPLGTDIEQPSKTKIKAKIHLITLAGTNFCALAPPPMPYMPPTTPTTALRAKMPIVGAVIRSP